jgi:hypothetical protein
MQRTFDLLNFGNRPMKLLHSVAKTAAQRH